MLTPRLNAGQGLSDVQLVDVMMFTSCAGGTKVPYFSALGMDTVELKAPLL